MLVAIRSEDGKRIPKMMRWGLLPHWAKDEKLSYSTFNARSEDFTTKPAFRDAWQRGQRCLVVTDGFYDGRRYGEGKATLRDRNGRRHDGHGRPLVAAGGTEVRQRGPKLHDPDVRAERCKSKLHDRMPVILAEGDWPRWLGEDRRANMSCLRCLSRAPTTFSKSGVSINPSET